MFHMTERIISLIRANFANWPELSRVPVERPPKPVRHPVWRKEGSPDGGCGGALRDR